MTNPNPTPEKQNSPAAPENPQDENTSSPTPPEKHTKKLFGRVQRAAQSEENEVVVDL
jgi:hypothetical protein